MPVTRRLRLILLAVQGGALFVLAALTVLWAAILISPSVAGSASASLPGAPAEPGPALRALLTLCAGPALLPAILALRTLSRLASTCRRGAALTEAAASDLRRLGAYAALTGVGGVLTRAAASVAISTTGPGPGTLAVTVGTGEVALLLAGGLLAALGAAMSEAARAAEENRGFV